jgi:FAD/FMN-containing dehydrogenase
MSDTLIRDLAGAVGVQHVLTASADVAPYAVDWRKRYFGRPLAVVRPASTAEAATVVRLCAAARTAVVPQGGNTGLCGAATPDGSGTNVVVSLARMNRVNAVDPVNNTLTVEAGCVLASVQEAAAKADRLFPLSLAAEGSCTIGGNLSTNAGGVQVLRYGNTRDLVLGIEAVLPSGEVWDGLRGLRKDNTGYDLKQLFIGAEGTLGLITAAVLKLFPVPRARVTAFVAVESPAAAVALLARLQARAGERLTAFELLAPICLDLVRRHFGLAAPFAAPHPQYVLLDLCDSDAGAPLGALAECALGEALESGIARDVVVATSVQQAGQLWALRENVSEAQALEGPNIKHDVSLPISSIAAFIDETDAALARAFPGLRMVTFGHVGDGNLHYNAAPALDGDSDAFNRSTEAVNRIVHDAVARFGGSISAEHGLGQYKRDEIRRYKSPLELQLMRAVKHALDPLGIMNPGKLIGGPVRRSGTV